MDMNNYSYTNYNGKSETIIGMLTGDVDIFLRHEINFFGEEFYVVEATSYDDEIDIYEEFDKLSDAAKLYEYIEKNVKHIDKREVELLCG